MLKFAPPEAFMLDQYRRDFAEINIACAREHYLFQSGQKNALEIAPIYEVKRLTEEIGQFEATGTVESREGKITFQDAAVAITKECGRKSRQTIYSRRLAVIEQSNTLRAERLLLGIRVDEQKNISIDGEPRRSKNPSAFCTPISIPDDIRHVIVPLAVSRITSHYLTNPVTRSTTTGHRPIYHLSSSTRATMR